MKFLRKFLLSLTLENLTLSDKDKEVMRTHNKTLRQVDYKWFTHKAYASNDQNIRMAAIWLRNEFMKDTASEKNGFEEERHLRKSKNNDYLPEVMRHEF